jgi:hypothetical protein
VSVIFFFSTRWSHAKHAQAAFDCREERNKKSSHRLPLLLVLPHPRVWGVSSLSSSREEASSLSSFSKKELLLLLATRSPFPRPQLIELSQQK